MVPTPCLFTAMVVKCVSGEAIGRLSRDGFARTGFASEFYPQGIVFSI
jgi:hypothetical protein